MARYVWADGAWVPFEAARAARVAILGDTMDALECPADGRTYDSRSKYDRAVRAAGCEIIGHAEHNTMRERPRPVADRSGVSRELRRLVNQ